VVLIAAILYYPIDFFRLIACRVDHTNTMQQPSSSDATDAEQTVFKLPTAVAAATATAAAAATAVAVAAVPAVAVAGGAEDEAEAEAALRALVTPARVEARLRAMLGKDGEISGTDSKEEELTSIKDLWEKEFKVKKIKAAAEAAVAAAEQRDWYQKGFDYWEKEENCPITDDGVLGGYGRLTVLDTRDSNAFLDAIVREQRPELAFNSAAGDAR
jgi:hypothetical protein